MREKISACVMTYNEENNIERCLGSLTWCDEIVVLDSFSEDRTLELARKYTDHIHQHPWGGYIRQRNMMREMAQFSWVLFLDADEEISDVSREEILREMEANDGRYIGFRFPRCIRYLGQWIRYGEWYPDVTLRLFLKDRGRSVGEEPHDKVVVDGKVKTLKNPILHYSHDSISDHINTINRFASIAARAKHSEGYRFRMIDFLFRPHWRFIKGFILRGGFLHGRRGYFIAMMNVFGVLVKYAKLWELELGEDGKTAAAPDAQPPDPRERPE